MSDPDDKARELAEQIRDQPFLGSKVRFALTSEAAESLIAAALRSARAEAFEEAEAEWTRWRISLNPVRPFSHADGLRFVAALRQRAQSEEEPKK